MSQRHIDTPPAARIAFLENRVEHLEEALTDCRLHYDELREAIDDGNESMDHKDALWQVRQLCQEQDRDDRIDARREQDVAELRESNVRLLQENMELRRRVSHLYARMLEDILDHLEDNPQFVEYLRDPLEQLNRVIQQKKCTHEWVDVTNEVVTNGQMCVNCGACREAQD